MFILIVGAGRVGSAVAKRSLEAGHEVSVLSRAARSGAPWRVVEWDGRGDGKWLAEIEGADAVINLAGRSVNCRYGVRNRRVNPESSGSIRDSTRWFQPAP